jgi:hypothetical protein
MHLEEPLHFNQGFKLFRAAYFSHNQNLSNYLFSILSKNAIFLSLMLFFFSDSFEVLYA